MKIALKKLLQETLTDIFIIVFALFSLSSCSNPIDQKTVKYINGYIYEGGDFKRKNFVIKEGKIYFDKSIRTYKTVDLNGKYVIPPFGDAHTHNFDDISIFDSIYNAYINEGTFYVQVLTNHHSRYLQVIDSLNKPGKIDVKFSHGGITSKGGHPHALYETISLGMNWRDMLKPENKEKIRNSFREEGDAYYVLDNINDVEEQWSEIIAKKPAILKLYISNFEARDVEIKSGNIGTYGLTKDVCKSLIHKANKISLPIYAHIESVDDFRWALDNGITHFAHMPGYGGGYGKQGLENFIIPDSILIEASKLNVVITPTVSFTKYYSQAWDGKQMSVDSILFKSKQDFIKTQLRRFYNAGIHLALGADQTGSTLREEIDDLIALDVFSNRELLRILINTPKAIFPNKKISEIKAGYEASLLVLNKNPLDDIDNIKNIYLRIKNGIVLD